MLEGDVGVEKGEELGEKGGKGQRGGMAGGAVPLGGREVDKD